MEHTRTLQGSKCVSTAEMLDNEFLLWDDYDAQHGSAAEYNLYTIMINNQLKKSPA